MIRINVPFSLDDYSRLDQLNNLPDEIKVWVQSVSAVNSELNKQKNIADHHSLIESNKHLWRDLSLIKWLLSLGKNKCWYTEVKFGADYPEVEHFRPKKEAKNDTGLVITDGYYWLAFNLTNYRLSKPMPNRKKGCYFPIVDESKRAKLHAECHIDEKPLFLDPLIKTDCLLLSFDDTGEAVAANKTTVQQKKRVDFTIKHFGLNDSLLNSRRSLVWQTTRELFSRYIYLTDEAERTNSARMTASAEEALENICILLNSSSEFSSVAKHALLKTGNEIAIGIAASCG